ncbi:MAG: hypothetical protein BWZ01_02888 [Deltaproteobacteria bacterium ADurb.BinA179]|nr:MAG: hypothetical protein BWZ01_02888 [Deltaproteobacteria bacterium ADurb.BinA179]
MGGMPSFMRRTICPAKLSSLSIMKCVAKMSDALSGRRLANPDCRACNCSNVASIARWKSSSVRSSSSGEGSSGWRGPPFLRTVAGA